MKNNPAALQERIGYRFKNGDFLTEALMHRSFAAENNLKFDNQRLEFLGDAVLQIAISVEIFRRYPHLQEGDLTKIRSALANQDSLAEVARTIRLGDEIMLGRGELETGGSTRDSTLADAFEALMGAILMDSDIVTAGAVTMRLIGNDFPHPEQLIADQNPKGALQEYCQHRFGHQPCYRTLSVSGPDHDPDFRVEVEINSTVLGVGHASKRKNAEMEAARNALDNIASGPLAGLAESLTGTEEKTP